MRPRHLLLLRLYAQEKAGRQNTSKTAAVGKAGDEERARTLFEVPGWRRNPALERKDFFRLQCGERFVRNDQLRGADGDFFSRRAAWT